MKIHEIIYVVLLIGLIQNGTTAEEIRFDWKIKNGDCQDCIKMPADEQSNYDFAVYKDQLFLSDYTSSKIKIFDKDNHNVKNLRLVAKPEIVTIFGDKLYILLKNNSLNIYDITKDSMTTVKLIDKFTELEYSLAFFMDSLLVLPLTKDFVAIKSDAKVFNIHKPESCDTIYGLFDFLRLMDIPTDGTFKHRPSKLIDLCGGNDSYLVLERFESTKTFKNSGYILFIRKDKTVKKLDPIPDKYGILIHSNAGRGMKISTDRIYFINEIIGDGENAIVIGSYLLK
jgi:hypothetical protein